MVALAGLLALGSGQQQAPRAVRATGSRTSPRGACAFVVPSSASRLPFGGCAGLDPRSVLRHLLGDTQGELVAGQPGEARRLPRAPSRPPAASPSVDCAGCRTRGRTVPVMAIKARLGGDSFDLDTLARLFREGDPHITADGEGYYLTSSMLDSLMGDGGKLYEVASSLLRKANGVARVRSPGFRPVRLTGRFSDDTGASLSVGTASAELGFRAFAGGVVVRDGEQQEPPPPGPEDIQLTQSHPDVAEALHILGKDSPSLTFFDLYKVVEIVRDHGSKPGRGKVDALIEKGWMSEEDIKAFFAAADRSDVSGDQARHARPKRRRTPSRRMTPSEAQQVVAQLVGRWLDSL
jgi:hypothetical protein